MSNSTLRLFELWTFDSGLLDFGLWTLDFGLKW